MTTSKQNTQNKNGKLEQMIECAALSVKLIKSLRAYEAEVPQLKKIATNLQKKLAKKYAVTFVVTRDMDWGGFSYDAEPDDVKIKIFGETKDLFDSIVEFTGAKYLGKSSTSEPPKWHENAVDVFRLPGVKIFMLLQTHRLRVESQKTAEIRFTNWLNGDPVVLDKKKK